MDMLDVVSVVWRCTVIVINGIGDGISVSILHQSTLEGFVCN